MTGDELEALVVRCLEKRVPPEVVADIFELDLELVEETLSHVRIERHGTDDLGAYLDQLQWETIEDALRVLKSGSAAEKARVYTMVLGKQVALNARRTPEAVRKSQGAVLELLEGMRGGSTRTSQPSKFIARRDDSA